MERYTFWNNKGGTGKTSLAFQVTCEYARLNPDKRILVVDACPQANLSELFLGGLHNGGSDNLLKRQGAVPRASIGGYFQMRLPYPFESPDFIPQDFITAPSEHNRHIPKNIDLLCGDPLLELQANAIATLANNQLPGINAWLSVIDWINDFLIKLRDRYDAVFFDTNPSFSIYTQIALAATDKLIMPVTADDASRRALQNAFSLIYGLRLPSEIYTGYSFSKLKELGRQLPKVHMIVKNRVPQRIKPAYATMLSAIENDVGVLLMSCPEIFTFGSVDDGFAEVRDFLSVGAVAYARGCPFCELETGTPDISGHRLQVKEANRNSLIQNIQDVVSRSVRA
jgi:cellulose biosynthesis protein BcsQ